MNISSLLSEKVFAWAIELKRKKGHSADYLEKLLKSKLALLDPMVGQKGDDARFLACLTRIQIHCRDITEQYMNKVFLLLPQLYGNAKVMALQVIGFAIDSVEDPFVALMKNKALIKMLKHTYVEEEEVLEKTMLTPIFLVMIKLNLFFWVY